MRVLTLLAQQDDALEGACACALLIVVDVTSRPVPGAGHPFATFDRETIEGQDDEDITCMVAEYDPAQEFEVVLLGD